MRLNTHMSCKNYEKVKEQVKSYTPEIVINLIADNLTIIDEAIKRISEEGVVVRDLKGGVIPHPAIKIETDVGKTVSDLMEKYRK